MKANWKKRTMDLARYISTWSKDSSTKVGCVIIDEENTVKSLGYNGFPRCFNDEINNRHERPQKYLYTVHAEENAILNAVRNGITLKDTIIYITYFPCNECAKAIINSGVKTLVTYEPNFLDSRWGESFKISHEMLVECGVKIIIYSDEHDDFYQKIVKNLSKSVEWNYKIISEFFQSQEEWNQTLITKINESGAMILKAKSTGTETKEEKQYFKAIEDGKKISVKKAVPIRTANQKGV